MTPEIDPQTGAAVLTITSRKHGTFKVLVDVDDWQRISQHTWSLQIQTRGIYFVTRLKDSGRFVVLHRFIMNAPEGLQVDHIHHNFCDLRKSELRLATRGQNQANSRKQRGTSSRYKGVYQHKHGAWVANITVNRKVKYLGVCPGNPEGEIECARRYDSAAREMHGEFALTNFPPPEQRLTPTL